MSYILDLDVIERGDPDAINASLELSVSRRSRLKRSIADIKSNLGVDVSRFQPGKVYAIKKSKDLMMINEIGPHPLSRVPTAYGFRCTADGHEHHCIPLFELGSEFI